MKKLTEKQESFARHKAAGLKNREAAVAAGYAPGSADVAAAQLMGRADIKSAIARHKRQAKEHAKALGVDFTSADDEDDAASGRMPKARYDNSLDFLMDAMNHPKLPIAVRGDYAKALLPYQNAKIGEKGKKESAKDRAREIAGGGDEQKAKKPGKFAPTSAPRLVVNNG